jgi:hypothetical protein
MIKFQSTGVVIVFFLGISIISSLFIHVPPAMAAGVLTNIFAIPTNNIVNTKTTYDIIFTTGTAGSIKTIDIMFPPGFNILSPKLIERSTIGSGILSVGTGSLIYTVISPVSIPAGSVIRLEVGNVISPGTLGSFTLTLTTKDSAGNTIDGPTKSSTFSLKQIGTSDIANNAITTPKIATGAVTANKIAGLSKIIFPNFCTISWPAGIQESEHSNCSVPGIAPGDSVLVTPVAPNPNGDICGGIIAFDHAFVSQNIVTIYVANECQSSSPTTVTYSILAFHH